jgi:hypothetical protein
MWPTICLAFGWVHRAAHFLANHDQTNGSKVRKRLSGLLAAMKRDRCKAGSLAAAIDHFAKVTKSYWPGLFACYDMPDLPRTNNDLEQFFGSHRHHERRATGRKVASPGLVLRGSARLIAAAATRQRIYTAPDLAGVDREAWSELRSQLETRRKRRTERSRFRKSPENYLQELEGQLLQSALPP